MLSKPLISKIRCYSPNKKCNATRNKNYLYYIATREGVDLSKELSENEILKELEYLEKNPDAEILHIKDGLFGNIMYDNIRNLSEDIYRMTANRKVIFNGVISLSEADAAYIGFCDKQKWIDFLNLKMPDIAEKLNIPITDMQWVAAYHKESGHPHCHYMLWSSSDKIINPYIHTSVQNKIRMDLSKEIFNDVRLELSLEKNAARDYLTEFHKTTFGEVKDFILKQREEIIAENKIPRKITNIQLDYVTKELNILKDMLPETGRITYKLIPEEVKAQADKIVDYLIKERPDIRTEYHSYINSAKDIAKSAGLSKKYIEDAMKNADADIRKRLANIILTSAKELRSEETKLDNQIQYEQNRQRINEYHKKAMQELKVSYAYKLINNAFSCFYKNNENNMKNQQRIRNKANTPKKKKHKKSQENYL